MGRIAEDDIRRVREATDLVGIVSERVVLKQKGRLYWACCPFHGEKTPSFKVDPATQLWHCFGCGLGGDVFGFVMRSDNLEFVDAVRALADRAHVEIHEDEGGAPRGLKDRIAAACDEAASFYHTSLLKGTDAGAKNARDYLSKRGFTIEVAKRFRVGYAPGHGALARALGSAGFTADELVSANLALRGDGHQLRDRFYERIMFPIFDLQGRCVAFGGRVLGTAEPKYLNTSETPVFSKGRNLYAIDRAKNEIVSSGLAVVVEGYTDVIALHEAGMRNVVATLGTALTREHVKLLGRFAKRVVYLFDGDEAGLRAADRAAQFIDATLTPEAGRGRVDLDVAVLPDGLDPADAVQQRGLEFLENAVAGAVPLMRFVIDRRLSEYDLDRPEQRDRALQAAAAVIAPVKDSIIGYDYANYLADKLFVDLDTVTRALRAARPVPTAAPASEGAGQARQEPIPERLTSEQQAEAELVALLVREPELRPGAQFLLSEELLKSDVLIAVARKLENAPTVPAEELLPMLTAEISGAAELMSGALLSEDDQIDHRAAAADLYRKLKEFDLQRRINAGRTHLKGAGEALSSDEQNGLFREVSLLTRELEQVRTGTAKTPFDEEV